MSQCRGCGNEILTQSATGPAPTTCGAPTCARDVRQREVPEGFARSLPARGDDERRVVDLRDSARSASR